MKMLCEYVGGSHLYGTSTPESDLDMRGVFMNTDPLHIYGFHKVENKVKQDEDTDLVLHELSNFLKLATKSNTQTLECLFAPRDAFTLMTSPFAVGVLQNRERFLCTDTLFKSLEGYLHNEMRLALGERTGLLGSKRKASLEKYGFSPKNFVHLMRLAECGRQFFLTGVYPVRVSDFNGPLHEFLMELKTDPGRFTKEFLIDNANALRDTMRATYQSMDERKKFHPDYEYVGHILHYFYSRETSLNNA